MTRPTITVRLLIWDLLYSIQPRKIPTKLIASGIGYTLVRVSSEMTLMTKENKMVNRTGNKKIGYLYDVVDCYRPIPYSSVDDVSGAASVLNTFLLSKPIRRLHIIGHSK